MSLTFQLCIIIRQKAIKGQNRLKEVITGALRKQERTASVLKALFI